jgi:hypothetical protein
VVQVVVVLLLMGPLLLLELQILVAAAAVQIMEELRVLVDLVLLSLLILVNELS